jgi:peptide/nickel transport system permease protein
MAKRDRLAVSDPESVPPEPVPLPADERGAELLEPPGRGAPTPSAGALLASAVLPGAGHFLIGAGFRGLLFLLPWGVLLGVLFVGWPKLMAIAGPGRVPLDTVVAAGALALTLVLVWTAALLDLRAAPGRAALAGGDSQWSIAARHFKKSKLALGGLFILFLLYVIAVMAPLIAPFDPIAQPANIAANSYLAPLVGGHPLGTDQFGRDVFSRILYGARISLSIGFVATAISVTLGTLLGAVAGYFGRGADTAIMRFTDMVLAFPRLVLLILIVALFSPSITLIIVVLGLTQWPGTTRIVRGDVLSLREREYIQAARALGYGRSRIIFRHLIPNVLAPVIVTATLGIGNTIVMEAGLSFLGLGVQPPTASWGNMVADGRQNLLGAWWVATFPGLVIVLTVLAFNLVGDGLRDALDPRLRT